MTSRKIIKLLQMPYAEAEAKGMSRQYKKAFKQVSRALNKQTPKKVLYEDVGYDVWNNQNVYACMCPSCGLRIFEFGDNDITSDEDFDGDGYDDQGNLVYDTWICPNCGYKYEVEYEEYSHCPKCGQSIDEKAFCC